MMSKVSTWAFFDELEKLGKKKDERKRKLKRMLAGAGIGALSVPTALSALDAIDPHAYEKGIAPRIKEFVKGVPFYGGAPFRGSGATRKVMTGLMAGGAGLGAGAGYLYHRRKKKS